MIKDKLKLNYINSREERSAQQDNRHIIKDCALHHIGHHLEIIDGLTTMTTVRHLQLSTKSYYSSQSIVPLITDLFAAIE